MSRVHNQNILKERRMELRRNSTSAEKILWAHLRGNKLGFKFKRQHSIGGYILDFYCHELRLIIELDGPVHLGHEAREYDQVRNEFFRDLDYTTLRFSNSEVESNIREVLERIQNFTLRPLQGEGVRG